MSDGKTKYEILSAIDSGKFIFQSKDSVDLENVLDFQIVVNIIKLIEKEGLVKVDEYHLSKEFPYHHPRPIDKILVENLTLEGEQELDRLNIMKQVLK
jgi:hypothetical protein